MIVKILFFVVDGLRRQLQKELFLDIVFTFLKLAQILAKLTHNDHIRDKAMSSISGVSQAVYMPPLNTVVSSQGQTGTSLSQQQEHTNNVVHPVVQNPKASAPANVPNAQALNESATEPGSILHVVA